jgi:SAM-dependent methyltransferase
MRLSFERVAQASRYRSWLLDLVRPWLGQRLLEIGCGVGNFTAELCDRERLVAVDYDDTFLHELTQLVGPRSALRRLAVDVTDGPALVQSLAEERLDSAVALNVLEHLGDDAAVLANVAHVLAPGSTIVLQVPAHQWLYGRTDEALGHCRRYNEPMVRELARKVGLHVEKVWQINMLGVLGWLVSSRWRQQRMFSRRQLKLYESLVPLQRWLEPADGVPLGLSVMAVLRCPA